MQFGLFLAPLFAVLIFNTVIFILVVGVLIKHTKRKLKEDNLTKRRVIGRTLKSLVSIVSVMIMFGLSWLFGALSIDKAAPVFQWFFVILNTLQGFFLFLFFCVMGKDAREEWMDLLRCNRKKRQRKLTAFSYVGQSTYRSGSTYTSNKPKSSQPKRVERGSSMYHSKVSLEMGTASSVDDITEPTISDIKEEETALIPKGKLEFDVIVENGVGCGDVEPGNQDLVITNRDLESECEPLEDSQIPPHILHKLRSSQFTNEIEIEPDEVFDNNSAIEADLQIPSHTSFYKMKPKRSQPGYSLNSNDGDFNIPFSSSDPVEGFNDFQFTGDISSYQELDYDDDDECIPLIEERDNSPELQQPVLMELHYKYDGELPQSYPVDDCLEPGNHDTAEMICITHQDLVITNRDLESECEPLARKDSQIPPHILHKLRCSQFTNDTNENEIEPDEVFDNNSAIEADLQIPSHTSFYPKRSQPGYSLNSNDGDFNIPFSSSDPVEGFNDLQFAADVSSYQELDYDDDDDDECIPLIEERDNSPELQQPVLMELHYKYDGELPQSYPVDDCLRHEVISNPNAMNEHKMEVGNQGQISLGAERQRVSLPLNKLGSDNKARVCLTFESHRKPKEDEKCLQSGCNASQHTQTESVVMTDLEVGSEDHEEEFPLDGEDFDDSSELLS